MSRCHHPFGMNRPSPWWQANPRATGPETGFWNSIVKLNAPPPVEPPPFLYLKKSKGRKPPDYPSRTGLMGIRDS